MLLAIDAGNSNLKLAVFADDDEDEDVLAHWRLTSNVQRTRDEYGADIRHLFQLFDLDPKKLKAIVIASVVPALNPTLTQMAELYFTLTPLFVDHTTRTGLKIAYDPPADLGADRIVDAVAAVEKYGAPCIVVDFGTATTFNVINSAGEFVGGAISPGLMTCAEALFSRAAKLPRVEFKQPARAIGSSTVTAMQAGLYHGYVGLVDGILSRLIGEMETTPRVIATGGLAHTIATASQYIAEIDDTLTLEGLRLVYETNQSLNYFNYFTEIEDTFVRRRGKHLFLSPMDWALMETWKQQGIPLHIVLRGIEKSFDSFESRPRKRTVKSLLYCQEEVEAQYAEWNDARVGASAANDQLASDKTPFSLEAVSEHLQRSRDSLLETAAARREKQEDDLSEAMTRAAMLLNDIEQDLAAGAPLDTRKLEDSLGGLERLLNNSMFAVASSDELEAQKTAVKEQLKPYRNHMETSVYNQTFNNLLLKRLREQFAVPRLSLFYV